MPTPLNFLAEHRSLTALRTATPPARSITWVFGVLVVVLALRIVGYFTLFTDSIAMTQMVKIGIRTTTTGGMIFLLFWLRGLSPNLGFTYRYFTTAVLYTCYLLLGFISLLWSHDVFFSTLQLIMVVESYIFSIIFYHILLYYDNYGKTTVGDALFSLPFIMARSITLVCSGFIIAQFIDPDTLYRATHAGEVLRLGGFIINPNELGMLAAVGVAALAYELLKRDIKVFPIFGIILNLAVLLLTQSRSTLGGLGLIILIYILQSKYRTLQMAVVVGGACAMPVILNTIIFKQGDVEEVMSMTGRLPFWQDLIRDGFTREPWLGFGFMRLDYTEYFDSIHAYSASMTHNTFLQVLLNLGIIGLIIVLLQMLTFFRAFALATNRTLQLFALGIFVPVFINSLTEFGIFGESNYGIMFFQLCFLMFIVFAERHRNIATQ
jgi:O-antigen ligase